MRPATWNIQSMLRQIALIALIGGAMAFAGCKSSKKSNSKKRQTPVSERPVTMTDKEAGDEGKTEEDMEEVISSIERRREDRLEKVLKTADSYMGTKHRMGGTTKSGIDCSGLVMVSYKSADLPLPRATYDQIYSGKKVEIDNLQEGDLVFFTYPGGKKPTHVGIVREVRGENDVTFIHTSSSKGVRVDNVFSNYWRKNFITARRVL